MGERRRNRYPGACGVCGSAVAAGGGWLYGDTSSRAARSHRRGGRAWPKVVRCDRCHRGGYAAKCQLPENRPAPRPKLGVGPLRAARFRLALVPHSATAPDWLDPVVELVLPDGPAEVVAATRPVSGEPVSTTARYTYQLALGYRDSCFGGRDLTPAAAKELDALGAYAAALYELWLTDPRAAE